MGHQIRSSGAAWGKSLGRSEGRKEEAAAFAKGVNPIKYEIEELESTMRKLRRLREFSIWRKLRELSHAQDSSAFLRPSCVLVRRPWTRVIQTYFFSFQVS